MSAPIILFDGICNFCNATVNFIIKKDKKKVFRFSPLQSEYASELLQKFDRKNPGDSILLLQEGKIYDKSTAALRIAAQLPGVWKLTAIFYLLPRFIRDGLYRYFSKHRYQWFGKREECMVPSKEVRDRFLI